MRGEGSKDSPSKVPLTKGLFRNGVWHCNCSPRLPAIQFTVRKETKNRGRTFYTCKKQSDKGNKCDFFLWAEDARAREMGAVLSNSRSENPATPSKKPPKQMTLQESITPRTDKRRSSAPTRITEFADLEKELGPEERFSATKSSGSRSQSTRLSNTSTRVTEEGSDDDSDQETASSSSGESVYSSQQVLAQTPSAGAAKRKRPDEDEFSDFSAGEQEQLAEIVEKSTGPGAQGRQKDVFATPAGHMRQTDVQDGMPTPLTEKPVRRVLFAEPEVSSAGPKRQRMNDGLATSVARSPSLPSAQTPQTPSFDPLNLTREVMDLLKGQSVDASVLSQVQNTLDKYATRGKGLELGRDASRDAVKKAEGRIAALQQKITSLESARKLDADARMKMRSDLLRVYTSS